MSNIEDKIATILNRSNIKYEREHIIYVQHYLLRFDFYISSYNIAIEVNGEQHYRQVKIFQNSRRDFMHQQENDRRKISYCLANGIKIYCVPYWEMKNIESLSDVLNPKFLARTKYHNDNAFREHGLDKT